MKNAFPSVGLLGALGLLLAALSATLSTPLAAQEPARRPNVVVILGDDQAWTDYGFMGHAEIRTPHLDRLAASGLVFEHGYVPSSLCRPSLASIVTGLYP
ncbi:MAG: Arylsulfatase precursor, partial [Planctomycetota bacterium]